MGKLPGTILKLILFGVMIYTISFFGYLYPLINQVAFWAVTGAVVYFSFKSLSTGVIIVLLELVIGNKGYLFSETLFGQMISIRYVIFFTVFCAALFQIIRQKKITFWRSIYRWWFAGFALFVAYGIINGFIRNDHTVWFYDLNAYIFFLLIIPFSEGIKTREHVRRAIVWLAGGSLALAVVTIVIAGIFGTVYYRPGFVKATEIDSAQLAKLSEIATVPESARLGQTTEPRISQFHLNWGDVSPERPILYRWLRDTGTAETAYLGGRIFRVFFSSHLYLLGGLFLGLAALAGIDRWGRSRNFWLSLAGLSTILIATVISFSRSLWLGGLIGFIVVLVLVGKRSALRIIGLSLAMAICIFSVTFIAVPGLSSAITDRFKTSTSPTTELAASNRLQLLPAVLAQLKARPILGSGFGTMVTYRTIVAGTDQLEFVRVYLYEWAYLDIAVKIGTLGLLGYLIFLAKITYTTWSARSYESVINKLILTGLLGFLTCIITANVFTPYLNHPLGIGAILFIALVSETLITRTDQTHA